MKRTTVIQLCAGLLCLGLLAVSPSPATAKSATQEFFRNVGESTKKAASETADYLDDGRITTQIKTLYVDETELDSMDISVSTENGVVTLTGKVGKDEQRALAEKIAAGVKGVKSVQNRLTLR